MMKRIIFVLILISCVGNSRRLLSTEFDSNWINGGVMTPVTRNNRKTAVFNYNNKIFVLGSEANPRSLYEYDTNTKQFRDLGIDTLNENITGDTQFWTQIGNVGYVLGDAGTNPTHLYKYALTSNGPSLDSTLTIPIDTKGTKSCITSNDNMIFIAGGEEGSTQSNRLQIYDFANGWLSNPPTMKKEREAFACVVVNDYLYALGGYNQIYLAANTKYLSTIEKIHITNIISNPNQWEYTSYNLLSGVIMYGAVVYGDYIVVIGGSAYNTGVIPKADAVQIIDTKLNTVTKGGSLAVDIYSSAVISVDNVIYAFGGGDWTWTALNTWQYLNIQTVEPTTGPTHAPTDTTYTPSAAPTVPTNTPTNVPSVSPTAPTEATKNAGTTIIFNTFQSFVTLTLFIVFGF